MTDLPFGFPGQGSSGGSGGSGGPGGQGGPGGPEDFLAKAPLFAELQRLLSHSGGPVNWDLARQSAIAATASASTPVTPADRAAVAESLRLADLWLGPVTSLPAGVTSTEAWSPVDWIERTLPGWQALAEPVAARMVSAMGDAIPAEMKAQLGPLSGMLGSIGSLLFGAQLGQGLAALAGEVLTGTDLGVPLTQPGSAALLPAAIAEFGRGLERPEDEVRLFLALREAAHHRLYRHVPWLAGHVRGAVASFADGITLDVGALQEAASGVDWSNPESMQEALASGVLQPENTPAQQAALARLETALALVEGWVDDVTAQAASPYLTGSEGLREMLRRRRATGGPAEQTFASLIGLEMRPRRLREASTLWHLLGEQRGIDGRDAVWAHPDFLPGSEDLADPESFVRGTPDVEPPTT